MNLLLFFFALTAANASIPRQALPWIWEGDGEDELPVVEMKINGQPVRAFFDTGANGLTMGESTARKLGLLGGQAPEAKQTGVFAGGKTSATYALKPVTLKVGNREFENFPAKVVEGADASHLWRDVTVGVELLRRARVLVDYKARTLRLLDRPLLGAGSGGKPLRFELVKGTHLMIVHSTLEGRDARLHFDTGGTFALNLFGPAARRLHLSEESRHLGGTGGGGQAVTTIHYQQPVRVCLLKICESVPAISIEGQDSMWKGIAGLYGHEIDGQISHEFLHDKQVEYDVPHHKIWIHLRKQTLKK